MAGGSNNVARMSPRQRMINLMYIVLTAMLALNVSADVLNGFSQVQEGLQRTTDNMSTKNDAQFQYLQSLYDTNPAQVRPWLEQGRQVKQHTDSLFKVIENLKVLIARQADGPKADYMHLLNLEDLEASGVVMLHPSTQRGKQLRLDLDKYREYILTVVEDSGKRAALAGLLSTEAPASTPDIGVRNWEQAHFENMPVIASITYLTHLQNNLRQAESDALTSVINTIDMGEMTVNELSAYVIPRSTMIMSGGRYEADIVLAAVDTTRRPKVYINGNLVPGGKYAATAGGLGQHSYSGFIEVLKSDGSSSRYPFKSEYTVIEPMATISPTMMNVIYAGIDNPISISAPGVPMSAITATITNGSLVRNGDSWTAHSSAIGQEAVISVSANLEGRTVSLGSMTFRVRKLPDPLPYMAVKDASGNSVQYKGTPRRISKAALMSCPGVSAALDDGILNIQYSVVSFQTVTFDQMGNAMPELSSGSQFSARQIQQFKNMKVGKSFFITNIKAKGPDGVTRDIPPMEVALN